MNASSPLAIDFLARLNDEVSTQLVSQVPLVGEVARHTIDSGGKRLRPIILLLSAASLGYQERRAIQLATAIEFVHTATLLHDDVVDSSTIRRGLPTANECFGNAAAVLVGDFLYSRAFQIMVDVGEGEVFRIMADATNDISEGEVLQLSNVKNVELTVSSYFEMIRAKTSRLFEAAAMLGGIVAGGGKEIIADLGRYGTHIGTAFQIVDDILDYDGAESDIGKKPGDDLAEGKITLPVIHALENGSKEDVAVIREAILTDGASGFSGVVDIFRKLDSLDYSRELARMEVELAQQSISSLPQSSFKDCMMELARNSLSRIN